MTGIVRTRELAAFRWTFFILLLLGMASTFFGITMMVLFDTPQENDVAEGMLLVGLASFCPGGIGFLTTQVRQRGFFVRTMRVCGMAIIVQWVIWLFYLELFVENGYYYQRHSFLSLLGFCSIMTAMVVIAANMLSLDTQSPEIKIGKRVVAYSLLICTVLIFIIFWFEKLWQYDFLTIGLSMLWAATILGLAAISLAVRRENKPRGKLVRTIPKRVTMKMACPRCEQWLEAPSGPARCDDCGLRLIIEIKEPRCDCGYLLYELQGNVCPECGRVIEQRESLNTPHSTSE